MAYKSTGKEELVGVVSLGDYSELRITRISDESANFSAVDIRNWYCTKNDSEMKPTQKGIRIKKENLAEVLNYIEKCRGIADEDTAVSIGEDTELGIKEKIIIDIKERISKSLKEFGLIFDINFRNNNQCIEVSGEDVNMWIRLLPTLNNNTMQVDFSSVFISEENQHKGVFTKVFKDLMLYVEGIDKLVVSSVCSDAMRNWCTKHNLVKSSLDDFTLYLQEA